MEWMFLPFQRYAEFEGRSCRSEYWMFALLQLLIIFVFVFGLWATGGVDSAGGFSGIQMVLLAILVVIFLGLFIPGIAVTIRRWHDLDQSGWFMLLFAVLGAIPFIGAIASIVNLVWFCLPGTNGPNKYGDDPVGYY